MQPPPELVAGYGDTGVALSVTRFPLTKQNDPMFFVSVLRPISCRFSTAPRLRTPGPPRRCGTSPNPSPAVLPPPVPEPAAAQGAASAPARPAAAEAYSYPAAEEYTVRAAAPGEGKGEVRLWCVQADGSYTPIHEGVPSPELLSGYGDTVLPPPVPEPPAAVPATANGAAHSRSNGAVHRPADGAAHGAVNGAANSAAYSTLNGARDGVANGAVNDAAHHATNSAASCAASEAAMEAAASSLHVGADGYTHHQPKLGGAARDAELQRAFASNRKARDSKSALSPFLTPTPTRRAIQTRTRTPNPHPHHPHHPYPRSLRRISPTASTTSSWRP